MYHSPHMKDEPPKKSKEQQNAKNPVDNRTSNGEHGKAGVPDKGDRVDAVPVCNGNKSGNKEGRQRQDPKIHDKRFAKNRIK